jgi:hypothetical protein
MSFSVDLFEAFSESLSSATIDTAEAIEVISSRLKLILWTAPRILSGIECKRLPYQSCCTFSCLILMPSLALKEYQDFQRIVSDIIPKDGGKQPSLKPLKDGSFQPASSGGSVYQMPVSSSGCDYLFPTNRFHAFDIHNIDLDPSKVSCIFLAFHFFNTFTRPLALRMHS